MRIENITLKGRTSEVCIHVGETLELHIPEAGSSGYLWDIGPVEGLDIVELASPARATGTIGGLNERHVRITGLKDGSLAVFHMFRPWVGIVDEDHVLRILVIPS